MRDNTQCPFPAETTGLCLSGTTRCVLFVQRLQDRADAGQRAVSCSYSDYRIVLMRDNALCPVRTATTGLC
jgi:hypothetical protein